ncbi:hypothetical protein [Siansivirga zeaxanthinifaciens]|uniref:DUF1735 domain-containing protein n=1 Tax=Siansivirga zeaxanthinifaciens CC-SAMT-1 TaxID=1454006 RepID=A0A0C5W0B9_9FLAO|nr:hypothetical protein [Siansivirga zeaxanthinifaciens]AJR04711.1 hypothetical protein AW14_01255 [Siansivirga zeaxanthinifaciens CC-SAMT-1]
MKKLFLLFSAIFTLVLLTNCEKNDDTPTILEINYVGFEAKPLLGVNPSANVTEELKIATSNTSESDRTFNIVVNTRLTTANASAYTVPSTVTVPANSNIGTFNVDLVGPNINPSGNDILALDFVSEEGLLTSNTLEINLKQICPYPETVLNIIFDGYGNETSWEIKDSSDTVLYSAALGTYAEGQANASSTFCLAPGTYTFTINDDFGDGLSFPANGSASILNSGNKLVEIVGDFGFGTSRVFTISN